MRCQFFRAHVPLHGWQTLVARRPGFLWDAQVALLSGVPVRVVDRCIADEGGLRAAVLGLFTVGGRAGRGRDRTRRTHALVRGGRLIPDRAAAQPGCAMGGFRRPLGLRHHRGRPITLRLLFEFDAAVGAVGWNGWWHAPLACGPS